MGFHDYLVSLVFDSSYSADDITRTLVVGGFIFTTFQFLVTAVMPAPYGRYAKDAPGITKWFEVNTTFAWVFQECPAFFLPLLMTLESWSSINWTQTCVLMLFMLHYSQRSLIFPFLLKSSSRTTPFLPCIMAFVFCTFNGFLQAHAVIYSGDYLKTDELFSTRFMTGTFLFLLGLYINVDSDRRLRALRRERQESNSRAYKIPYGGAFEYVSAANYFGEILEWFGFCLAARNLGGVFFAVFAAVFLGTRGVQHHKYYLEQFGDRYPKQRKAVIPFIL